MQVGDLVEYKGFEHEPTGQRLVGVVVFVAKPPGPENIELASVHWSVDGGTSSSSRLYKTRHLEVING
tara:strand:+ start:64 stop:267 length:204 start_codon:yes stop_codon:yes gene_type:complete